MGIKVERFQDFEGDRKYLFFGDELHGGAEKENHDSILQGSGRDLVEILVAGGYLRSDDEFLVVDGNGSWGLRIARRDPTPVVDFIKSFPDSAGRKIITP